MRLRNTSTPVQRLALAVLGPCALALAALLAGCGGGTSTPTPAGSASATGIPTATPYATLPPVIMATASAGAGGEVSYTVQPGDSLLAIAARFGTTVEAIQSRNNLSGSDIYVGQALAIPGVSSLGGATTAPAGTATPAAGGATAGVGGVREYVVVAGDTASGIAAKFNTTVEALAAANGTTAQALTNLQIGQKLQVPSGG